MNTVKSKSTCGKLAALTIAGTFALGAGASSITIDSVTQRWPWNNKVDITYTVSGGQTRSAGVYCGLRFAVAANGQTYDFEGYTLGASAENGQHTVTWTAPTGVKALDASITATLFTTNVPSGNDYMIIDLGSGAIYYEGLMATQDDSNERYNVAEYKEDKMVLRKVPKWADRAALPNAASLPSSGYPTGDNTNYSSSNSERKWATDKDFYVGVFNVTRAQYVKVGLSLPSGLYTAAVTGDTVNWRPVGNVSFETLRGQANPTNAITPDASGAGFLERLNYRTKTASGISGFDMPTEVMCEIATRAGTTSVYFWGDSAVESVVNEYCVCGLSSGQCRAVGSRKPNGWGLYDMSGNASQFSLDDTSLSNLANATSVFVPAYNNGANCHWGHGIGDHKYNAVYHRSSDRESWNRSGAHKSLGLRVYFVVK